MFRFCFAMCCLVLAAPAPGRAEIVEEVADRIFYGGEIVSVDDANPSPEAVAVGKGRIIGVGTLAEVVKLRGAGTELFDLEGRTLAPGFIDTHSHLSRVGLQAISANLMRPPEGRSRSIADIQYTLRRWRDHSHLARELGLIIGYGFDDSQLTTRRWLTRDDLDAVAKDLPVIAIHHSGHRSVFNSRALEMAGIRAETPDPQGGVIHRRPGSHEPIGVLDKTAHDIALRKILSHIIEGKLITLIDAGQQLYARYGHTTAQDGRPEAAVLEAYPQIAAEGRLKIDVIAYPDLRKFRGHPALSGPYRSESYSNGFRIGGVMLRLDGAPRPETERLRQSYLRLTSVALNRIGGLSILEDGEVAALLSEAFRNGWQVVTFADSDGAIDQFIRTLRIANASVPGEKWRPVLIQGQRLTPAQLKQLRKLGAVPALFPATGASSGAQPEAAGTGRQAAAASHDPARKAAFFTAYHDAPATPPDMMRVMSETLARAGPYGVRFAGGQSLSRLDALKSITLWAARQYREEEIKGSIEVGKLADLVILSANPLAVDPRRLTSIEVLETIKQGDPIHVREGWDRNSPEKEIRIEIPLACGESDACFKGITAALDRAGLASEDNPNFVQTGRSASLDGQ